MTLYHTHLHLQLQLRVDVPQRDEAALPRPALVLGAALRQLQGDPQPAGDEVAGGEGGHLVTSVSGSITRGGCLDGGWWVTCDEISWKGPNQVGRWVGVARWPHHVTLWGAGHVLLSAGAGYIVSVPLHHTHYKPGDTPTHVIIMLVLLVVR